MIFRVQTWKNLQLVTTIHFNSCLLRNLCTQKVAVSQRGLGNRCIQVSVISGDCNHTTSNSTTTLLQRTDFFHNQPHNAALLLRKVVHWEKKQLMQKVRAEGSGM